MSIHHGLRSAAGASVADPYFANTSLLLLGNGTNGGQNNSFVDGSSNAFSITRYGNTTQGTFSPFGYNWSNYFDGSGDYLTAPANSALSLGTGDFTLECWVYATSTPSDVGIYEGRTDGNTTTENGFTLTAFSSSVIRIYSNGILISSSGTTYVNAWCHVAVTRSSGTWTLYINGTSQGTSTSSRNMTNNDAVIGGGRYGATSAVNTSFPGYISNFRITKSVVYSSNFTPPTAPLTAITNTSLLTCQSNRFLDNSSNAFTITPYGNAAVTNFAPFPTNTEYSTGTNGGSGYFDGSGDYLTIPSNTALDLGTGDFTVEAWVYLKSTASDWFVISSTGSGGLFFGYTNTTTPGWGYGRTAVAWDYRTGVTSSTDAWHHVAMTRSGTSIRFFVNGTQAGTTQTSSQSYDLGTTSTSVGSQGAAYYLNGNISSLRVLKGTAQYTANFTPSTTPLTSITNTSLLLNFTNGSIIDSTGKNDLETVGDAQISTATKKYGTGSLKFDGTGDYLVCNGSTTDLFAFGTGDFTIEFWLYLSSTSGPQIAYDGRPLSTPTTQPTIYIANGGSIRYYTGSADRITGSTLNASQWYHIAVSRSGTSTKLFVDGTQSGSTYTDSTSYTNTSGRPVVGIDGYNMNANYLNGYIDDLRITKGVARYTSNFTAPTRQLPAR